VTPRALVLLLFVAALLVAVFQPVRAYVAERSHLTRLEHSIADLERGNDRLEEQIARLKDPRYIEALARLCLGMVKPGEIAFVPIPEGGKAQPPPC